MFWKLFAIITAHILRLMIFVKPQWNLQCVSALEIFLHSLGMGCTRWSDRWAKTNYHTFLWASWRATSIPKPWENVCISWSNELKCLSSCLENTCSLEFLWLLSHWEDASNVLGTLFVNFVLSLLDRLISLRSYTGIFAAGPLHVLRSWRIARHILDPSSPMSAWYVSWTWAHCCPPSCPLKELLAKITLSDFADMTINPVSCQCLWA